MDLKLENGDLVLTSSINNFYDLSVETDLIKEDINLIKRAVLTPITYITEWDAVLNEIDNLFGNPLYSRLSDPLTINWMTSARKDIVNAVKNLKLEGTITEVEMNVRDFENIKVVFTYNNNRIEISLI